MFGTVQTLPNDKGASALLRSTGAWSPVREGSDSDRVASVGEQIGDFARLDHLGIEIDVNKVRFGIRLSRNDALDPLHGVINFYDTVSASDTRDDECDMFER